jgi:ATP-dependent DNA ligase
LVRLAGFQMTPTREAIRKPWARRRKRVDDLPDGPRAERIGLVPVTADAPALWQAWVGIGGKGVVLKERGSVYRPGMRLPA